LTVLTAAVLAAAHGAVQSTASLDDRRARTAPPDVEATASLASRFPQATPPEVEGGAMERQAAGDRAAAPIDDEGGRHGH
jgi:hypothetical protein